VEGWVDDAPVRVAFLSKEKALEYAKKEAEKQARELGLKIFFADEDLSEIFVLQPGEPVPDTYLELVEVEAAEDPRGHDKVYLITTTVCFYLWEGEKWKKTMLAFRADEEEKAYVSLDKAIEAAKHIAEKFAETEGSKVVRRHDKELEGGVAACFSTQLGSVAVLEAKLLE